MFDYFKGKNILITGAAGFIGSNLVKKLLSLDANIVAIDNLLTGNIKNLSFVINKDGVSNNNNFRFINADVIKPVETYFLPSTTNKIDLLLHFASPASPPKYQKYPIDTYLVNSIATHNLANFLFKQNPKGRFLFASTSEVYGDPKIHPQKEEYFGNVNPNGKRSCYDESKRLGETICGVFNRDYGFDTRIVRIFNTYGPNMDPLDGRVIPNFIMQSLKNDTLNIYGDGSFSRSYCYIDDLVEYILRMSSFDNLSGKTINIGNPEEFTILETAKIIYSLINNDNKIKINYLSKPEDDPEKRKPDISKAIEFLKYEPKVNFKDGLKKTVEYFKK